MPTVASRVRALWNDESGQTVVLAAVAFVALLGCVALAVDIGQCRVVQRQLQATADAAALAGALEIGQCHGTADCSAITGAAQEAMTQNGFSNSQLLTACASSTAYNLSVTVNNGPCAVTSDPHSGNAQYVEAVVSKVQPTLFAGVLGISSVTLSARAEAAPGNDPYCIYLSGTSGVTLETNASSALSASCGLMMVSNGSPALQADSGSSVSVSAIEMEGSMASYEGATISPSTAVVTPNIPSDPLGYLTAPSVGGCTYNNTAVSGTATLSPGTYCGGISTSKNTTVTFQSGLYIIEGGMAMNDGVTATGNNVTFYVTSGTIQFNKSATLDLVAPTTGSLAGILFWQASGDTNTAAINSGAGATLQGALYFPGAQLQLNGSNDAAYTILDAKSLQLDSGSTFNVGSDYSSLSGGSPAKGVSAVLAE